MATRSEEIEFGRLPGVVSTRPKTRLRLEDKGASLRGDDARIRSWLAKKVGDAQSMERKGRGFSGSLGFGFNEALRLERERKRNGILVARSAFEFFRVSAKEFTSALFGGQELHGAEYCDMCFVVFTFPPFVRREKNLDISCP